MVRMYNIIGGTANAIEALYTKANTKVLISSEISKTFNNTFNIYLENIVAKALEEMETGMIVDA